MSQTVLDNRYYYTYKGVHFGIQFPIECAVNNIPNTGPECANCHMYSTVENSLGEKIFMGYCSNCIDYIYNDSSLGVEYSNNSSTYVENEDPEESHPEESHPEESQQPEDPEEPETYRMDLQKDFDDECENEEFQENPFFHNGYDSY